MKIELWQGDDSSAIVADGRTIEYTQRTHRGRAEDDYRTVVTEYRTYGDQAAHAVLDYLATARRGRA